MIETMLSVTVEDSGAAVVRRIVELLRQEHNAATRGRLLRALSFAPDPATAAEVRALALDPALRVNEVPLVVFGAVRQPQSRADGWAWFKDNFDAIAARTPPGDRGGLAAIGAPFCTAREREDYRHFFQGKIKSLAGARRIFAATMEQIDTCVGLIAQQRPRIARALTQAAQP
jgi:alanyl aminopeptidase